MALIVAIETDARQAAIVSRVVRDQVGARLVVVSSNEQALAAIAREVPDLVLLSALLSPRDEEEIVAYLRTLDGASHLQTLTIPRLADGPAEEHGRLAWLRRRRRGAEAPAGCDPARFGEEVAEYLARARAIKRAQTIEDGGGSRAAVQRIEIPPDDAPPAELHPVQAVTGAASATARAAKPTPAPPPAARPVLAPRPSPLAMWARQPASTGGDQSRSLPPRGVRETRALLAALDLPPGVAEVGVRDCRIRRVRTRHHVSDESRLPASTPTGRTEPGTALHAVA